MGQDVPKFKRQVSRADAIERPAEEQEQRGTDERMMKSLLPTLLSGRKSNKASWLEETAKSVEGLNCEKACKMGIFSSNVTLGICVIE